MIRVNLLDASVKEGGHAQVRFGRSERVAAVCLGVATLCVAGGWWWTRAEVFAVLRQLEREQARLAAMAPEVQQVATMRTHRAQLGVVRGDLEARRARGLVASSFLSVLGEVMPADLWLLSLDYTDTEITLEGRGASVEAVAQWVERLNATPEWPWLVAVAETARVSGSTDVAFSVRGRVR